jgi:hypothetical protein
MAIPASGPLALTDIQTEFGGSNPIGLNEYYAGGSYVPAGTSGTYGAVPSSGAISIQNFYGTSNGYANWIITFTNGGSASNNPIGNCSAVDSSGNLYLTGVAYDGDPTYSGWGWYFVKTKQTPLSTASITFTILGYTSTANSKEIINAGARAAVDSSGNVYIAYTGPVTVSGTVGIGLGLAKYNSSGTLQWSKTIGRSDYSSPPILEGIIIDSSGYIYITGSLSSVYDLIVGKYDSSGTLQWLKIVSATVPASWYMTAPTGRLISGSSGGGTNKNNIMALDSSNNLYLAVLGESATDNTITRELVMVVNSSGTLLSKTIYGVGSTSGRPAVGGSVIGSGDTYRYTAFNSNAGSGGIWPQLWLAKYTNGTPSSYYSSTVLVPGSSGSIRFDVMGIQKDSSDNLYIILNYYPNNTEFPSGSYGVIVKYNSSLTLQWQRKITADAGYITLLNSIQVDSSTTFIVTGRRTSTSGTNGNSINFRLPLDGSKTGTYGIYTYAASSFTTTTLSSSNYSTSPVPVFSTVGSNIQSVTTTMYLTSSTLPATVTGI